MPRIADIASASDAKRRVEFARILDMNLTGTFYIAKFAARAMRQQASGCIINVSSSVGRKGRAEWGAYAVSKFGVEGLTQVLAEELCLSGVCVVSFNPGGTRTAMRARAYPHENRTSFQEPAVPARALLQLAARASLDISGQAFDLQHLPDDGKTDPSLTHGIRKC